MFSLHSNNVKQIRPREGGVYLKMSNLVVITRHNDNLKWLYMSHSFVPLTSITTTYFYDIYAIPLYV